MIWKDNDNIIISKYQQIFINYLIMRNSLTKNTSITTEDTVIDWKEYIILQDQDYNLIWILVDWINNIDLKYYILDKFEDIEVCFNDITVENDEVIEIKNEAIIKCIKEFYINN